MRGIIAVCLVSALVACADESPEDPRDRKVPMPKTAVMAAVVQVEPLDTGIEQPLIMRAVLRCRMDAEGRTRCELEVPRSRAPMV